MLHVQLNGGSQILWTQSAKTELWGIPSPNGRYLATFKKLRITVSHNKSKEEIVRAVDRSFDDLFQGIPSIPIKVVPEEKNWQGSTLTFSLTAKMGLLRSRIKGSIEVTEGDLIVDVDLGLFERLISGTKAREAISSRVRGLLT